MIPHPTFALVATLAVLAFGSCSPPGDSAAQTIEITADVPSLLLIGIDGATFDRILPLAEDGRLPNL